MKNVFYRNCEFLREVKPSEYNNAALAWLRKHKIKLTITYVKTDLYFKDDTEIRNIYRWTFKSSYVRKGMFGDSVYNTQNNIRPTAYDILACITKYDPDSFESFCSEFGYDLDSMTAHKTYKQVKAEWQKVRSLLFDKPEALEELREIN